VAQEAEDICKGNEAVSYAALPLESRSKAINRTGNRVFASGGAIAFGGPYCRIKVVNQRQWMSREKLLDLLGITNLIPGPNSTEPRRHTNEGGGSLIAGSCFILPAMLIVWLLPATKPFQPNGCCMASSL